MEIVDSCQLAIFLREPPTLDALKLWDMAVGSTPTGFQTVAPGHTQAQGSLSECDLSLVSQVAASRIDLHLVGKNPGGPTIPVIPDLEAALKEGIDAIGRMVDALAVGRMATVLQGHTNAADARDSVLKLKQFVPHLQHPEGAEEATYRVLVPRPSQTTANRRINQICQWQSVQIQFVQINPTAPMTATPRTYAADANIDVFAVGMLVMDSATAMAELHEVSSIATKLLWGGYDELA